MTNVYAGKPVSDEDIKILVDVYLKRGAAVTDIQMKQMIALVQQMRALNPDQKREFQELEKNLSVLETDTNVRFPM